MLISELLKRGFDIYIPLVDDQQQLDCIIKKVVNGKSVYIDIQISKNTKITLRSWGLLGNKVSVYEQKRIKRLTINV